jgi:DNA invertase Pin-like site-specific DNA recombinase
VALKACRLQGAKLIIAKLDRLARNVAFISNLMESKVEFEAVDFPDANRLTIHIMAAIAEHEAKMISDRTHVALAAAIDQGQGEALADQFRKDLRMLVAEFGQPAIDAALGGLPDAASPSAARH